MLLFTYSITAALKRAWIVVHGVSADSAEKSGMRVEVSAAFPPCWKVWSTASPASSNSASPSTTPTLHLAKPIASLPAASSCKMQSMSGKAATAATVSCVFSCTKLCSSILVKHVYRLQLSMSIGVFRGRIQLIHQRLLRQAFEVRHRLLIHAAFDSGTMYKPAKSRTLICACVPVCKRLCVCVCRSLRNSRMIFSIFPKIFHFHVLTRNPGTHHRKNAAKALLLIWYDPSTSLHDQIRRLLN